MPTKGKELDSTAPESNALFCRRTFIISLDKEGQNSVLALWQQESMIIISYIYLFIYLSVYLSICLSISVHMNPADLAGLDKALMSENLNYKFI